MIFFDALGNELGRMYFTEIEQIIPCFMAGTEVDTPDGPRPVESVRPGDLVHTLDDGPQIVRWVGHRTLRLADLLNDPDLRPVEFAAGSLGPDVPDRPLTLSPQQRLLFSGAECELCFGEVEVLAPAIHLAERPGVGRPLTPLTYVQRMFDRHQIVCTHGVWRESFQPGGPMLDAMSELQRKELFRLFPELASGQTYVSARPTLKAHETRLLALADCDRDVTIR